MPSLHKKLMDAIEKRLALEELTDSYRLVNGEADGFPHITIDKYGTLFQIQLFSKSAEKDYIQISEELIKIFNPQFLVTKWRTEKAGATLENPKMKILVGDRDKSKGIVKEGPCLFHVDLLDTINPGLFLDMRRNRLEIGERIGNGKFLNLFSYTCSFSVHAKKKGAQKTINADISGKILEKGRDNYLLNELKILPGEFFRGNAIEYVDWALKKGVTFDGIVLDPPSFARHKGFSFNVREHLLPLVSKCTKLLNPKGFLMVSSNYSEFQLEQFSQDVFLAAKKSNSEIKKIWSKGQDIDFPVLRKQKDSSLCSILIEV